MRSNSAISYDAMIENCIQSISTTGGDVYDALVIEAHFGLIGDWVTEVVTKIKNGVATIEDVNLITSKFEAYAY